MKRERIKIMGSYVAQRRLPPLLLARMREKVTVETGSLVARLDVIRFDTWGAFKEVRTGDDWSWW